MTNEQEDALYDFLETAEEPFTIKDAALAAKGSTKGASAGTFKREIADLFTSRGIVFPVEENKWISRYGYFRDAEFTIKPSRLELENGILIPGHRCVPFANPYIMQSAYVFYWNGTLIEGTNTEGTPQDFYPFFSIYGEEYASQYIARDNMENEIAFNSDPSEDPQEVSLHTCDMRRVYREDFFKPGDSFAVTIKDWRKGEFNLRKQSSEKIDKTKLDEWLHIAEDAFFRSFETSGPTLSTELQIAWAYFYGGQRMKTLPAYSLEEFIFEKSDKIDIAPFGLETRFWYAGKEIPDYTHLEGLRTQPDDTPIEKMLLLNNIPVSEYVVQSYVTDSFYRSDDDIDSIVERIAPPSLNFRPWHREYLAAYVVNQIEDTKNLYSIFRDQKKGPLRQSASELHTAVISLAARLANGEIDYSILPKQTFIVLSQIQIYCAGILEDIDLEDEPSENELLTIENSMLNMIDVFDELKELINKSRDQFRRNNIKLVKPNSSKNDKWYTIQVSLGGTDIWRRLNLAGNIQLVRLKKIIAAAFNFSGTLEETWLFENTLDTSLRNTENSVLEKKSISELTEHFINEFVYEYGKHWTIKIFINPCTLENTKKITCIAGEGCAPNEAIEGPLRLRRYIRALNDSNAEEKALAKKELGADFNPSFFDIAACNKRLSKV
ncbi:MAG: hypothetical protein Ta2G_15710 [Termitinemataceae bacterium]|nr:MAG: hypothetical protein Ta2G_15710 [Termitinemataceae bacterium]